MATAIQLKVADDCDRFFLFSWSGTSQNRPHTHQQFSQLEGFGNIIIRSEFKTVNDIRFLLFCGNHNNRQIGSFPQLADKLIPVHIRHHDIEQNQVRL